MKWLSSVLFLMPTLALAAGAATPSSAPVDGPPPFGLSGNVIGERADGADRAMGQTRRLIHQQAHSGPPEQSEISAPIYVKTQQRLSKSFDQPIPDFDEDQTLGSN